MTVGAGMEKLVVVEGGEDRWVMEQKARDLDVCSK